MAESKALARAGDEMTRTLLLKRLGPRASAWSRLPLVVRLRSEGASATARRAVPTRVLDLAPPRPAARTLGKQGSYLLLDASELRLTFVLYDWDVLDLRVDALRALGIPPLELLGCLQRGSRSLRPDAPARWSLACDDAVMSVRSGNLDGASSPVVGRIHIGTVAIDQQDYAVEVVALPRIVHRRAWPTPTVDLGEEDDGACVRFLERTSWCSGSPAALLGMLRLAHGEAALSVDTPSVRLSVVEDPSPLAWLALAGALEHAAEHQRRTYVRAREVRRTPVGTIDMGSWLGQMARQRADRVPVRRHVLSADSLENRLFRGIADRMARRLHSAGDLAAWLATRFDAIQAAFSQTQLVPPEAWMCDALLDRDLPVVIQRAVEQCRLALEARYPGLTLRAGVPLDAQTFELDLAMLFEAAMRRLVGTLVDRDDMEVLDGNANVIEHGIRWLPGGGDNRLKPDWVVCRRRDGAVMAIGDAKYKRPFRASSYAPLNRPDFHQLLSYMLAWPQARWGLVLMPGSSADGAASTLLQELTLADRRKIGLFEVDAARWGIAPSTEEPLKRWIDNCSRPTSIVPA